MFSARSWALTTSLLNLPHAVAACPCSLARALTGRHPKASAMLFKTKTNEDESLWLCAWIKVFFFFFFISFSNYSFLSPLTEQIRQIVFVCCGLMSILLVYFIFTSLKILQKVWGQSDLFSSVKEEIASEKVKNTVLLQFRSVLGYSTSHHHYTALFPASLRFGLIQSQQELTFAVFNLRVMQILFGL